MLEACSSTGLWIKCKYLANLVYYLIKECQIYLLGYQIKRVKLLFFLNGGPTLFSGTIIIARKSNKYKKKF